MKRPTKRDADTESLEQAVAVPTLAPCVTIAFIASGNRWPPLDKRSVKLSSPPPASQSTFANRVILRQTLYNLSQLSGTFTNGAQLTPNFISKRRQSFCMLKVFNKHNVRQHSPANINSYKLSATLTSGATHIVRKPLQRWDKIFDLKAGETRTYIGVIFISRDKYV